MIVLGGKAVIESILDHQFNEGAVFLTNVTPNGQTIVGFDNFLNKSSIEMYVAGGGGITRRFLRECFRYAFETCGVDRVTAQVDEDNEKALDLDRRLGFVDEGRIRKGKDGKDILILGMLRDECRWI